ncbi:MAG: DUF3306 domain-containing protein [Rhodobacteraceae bacterium]|nr:DUF3306 domain-containing protein [Paracoccaceae bacterium]
MIGSENVWSRRRAAVLAEAKADTKAAEQADAAIKQAEMAKKWDAKSDADILQELNLKDPDQMQQGDDFASFLLAEVPDRLRKRALRVLWRSNPVLACVDDLLEYGDDFKAEWDGADLIKTVYRVGKGMLPDVEETPEVPEVVAEAEVTEDRLEDTPEELELAKAAPEFETPDQDAPQQSDLDRSTDDPMPPRRHNHRMRFEFDEVT